MMIISLGLHIQPGKVWGRQDIRGFDRVAELVVADRTSVAVFYGGYFNGKFIFHMRAEDGDRRVFAFRASKLLFLIKWLLSEGYKELQGDVSEFLGVLDRYSIKHIVQEAKKLNEHAGKQTVAPMGSKARIQTCGRIPHALRTS